VPTENPVYPGDELLLSGQALILGVRTMKRALGAISNQNIADEIVSMARETPGWLASDPCPGRGIIGAILRGYRSANKPQVMIGVRSPRQRRGANIRDSDQGPGVKKRPTPAATPLRE
jgi:hypothetical protein